MLVVLAALLHRSIGDTSAAADTQQMGPPQAPEDVEGNGGATEYSIRMEFDKSIKEFTESEIIGPGFNSGNTSLQNNGVLYLVNHSSGVFNPLDLF